MVVDTRTLSRWSTFLGVETEVVAGEAVTAARGVVMAVVVEVGFKKLVLHIFTGAASPDRRTPLRQGLVFNPHRARTDALWCVCGSGGS
jgi:hypothetical protein